MFSWALKKVFGTSHDRAVRRMRPKVAAINALEPRISKLTDEQLRAKTAEFKTKLDNGATLDDLLIEAFAVCREAGVRALGMRHYDVQLMGGMVLHQGGIAEMKTGEGKTLVATLAMYLNALEGKGAHLVTVNDYLAKRDAEWMGRLYSFLGLSTGVIVAGQTDAEKKHAYQCDITYGQNNEFGFDYLRDNMKFSALEYVQRPLHYAIVDEVDSILIDEARTPLIISGQGERSSEKYIQINEIIPKLRRDEHYVVDEKAHSVTLTDEGVELAQRLIGVADLYDPRELETLHILNQCLRAHTLYKRDTNYMVTDDGKILIIDEFTGRALPGRRWSDGLHQAVEAKENVPVQEESRTMATITFQNLFRLYDKLAGMTGTADTEAGEFHSTYDLDVTVIPTNKPLIREDREDIVYKTEREKFTAVIREILKLHEKGVPVLVGTTSVEKSAAISKMLKKRGVPHNVLNAKHHEQEAYVVAQAGSLGAITVSTNMAGRGTDIILGGNPEMLARYEFIQSGRNPEDEPEEFAKMVEKHKEECAIAHDKVIELGGLHIIGTERHESRRIDNQLRGRAGRQGDPGMSVFYLSLEDDLMRIFGGDRVKELMDRMGMPDDEPIEHPWVTKSIENAQTKVETRNFDIRKNLLEYDDVMNAQRKTVYEIRQQLLTGRYHPDEIDELGNPTGRKREIKPMPELIELVAPMVGQLIGLFLEQPIEPEDEQGKPRVISPEDVAGGKIVEREQLQEEIYQRWGVVVQLEEMDQDPKDLLEHLQTFIPTSLTEQRERALDLMDRVLGSIIEELCPANRPPEDWDWPKLKEAFEQHFSVPPKDIEHLGDQEMLARELYKQAEAVYVAREKELGPEVMLTVFRQVYLQEIDKAWIDHLTNMDHLRDGIGLRGYGQRDPKQEYKREGYNMFLDMMAAVSAEVVTKMLRVEVRREGQVELDDLYAAEKAQEMLEAAAAQGFSMVPQISPGLQDETEPEPEPPAIGPDDPCPCGSGKPFKECHGEFLDDEDL